MAGPEISPYSGESSKRYPRPGARSWIMHAALILGAAILTARLEASGRSELVGYISGAAWVLMSIAISCSLVISFRGNFSQRYRGGLVAMLLGVLCMGAARPVPHERVSLVFTAACILFLLGGAAALFLEVARIRRRS